MPPDTAAASPIVTWKNLVTNGLYRTGMLNAFHALTRTYEIAAHGPERGRFRKVRCAKYLVLGYHRVGIEGPPLYSTLPQSAFAAQMRYLKHNFRVISVDRLVQELQESDVQGQTVVVTFDDGYAGTYTEALPVLREYAIPATVYLTGEAIETGEISWYDRVFLHFQQAGSTIDINLDKPERFSLSTKQSRLQGAERVVTYLRTLPDEERRLRCAELERMIPLQKGFLTGAMLTWDQIHSMQSAGITFGAHTMTHPVVSRLSPKAAQAEVLESKRLIENRLGIEVKHFAYPFGKVRDCGSDATGVLQQLGFASAMTTILGLNEPGADVYRLRRLVLNNDTSIARFALQLHRLFFYPEDEELSHGRAVV